MNKKEIIMVSLKLFLITAIAALCLAGVNKITSPVIEKNRILTIEAAQREVLESADRFEKITDFSTINLSDSEDDGTYVEEVNKGITSGGVVAGYVVSAVSSRGYGGDIKVMVGITKDLKINRVKITESKETAGLGLKASEPEFIDQFIGRAAKLKVIKNSPPTKDGEDIAAISSATVTSKAVTNAVNKAYELVSGIEKSGALDNKAIVENIKNEIDQETERQIKEGE